MRKLRSWNCSLCKSQSRRFQVLRCTLPILFIDAIINEGIIISIRSFDAVKETSQTL
ncbi:hypothetical protein M5D96_001206 [Drosophila gunungcola]|uniref:Uncharacterized protein n=1 Tax=Drosophila gunungcola TaxID=103775 RepID=A0A9P9YYI6_9MUSC|nr:hypothetical protein M5D96_001206 [Drosophila gunungcola]